ncbi:MAG: hypothetical protein J6S14_02130 [Clostridia bacterium]|nr:hypothetical protein [Clostridia bacterium]
MKNNKKNVYACYGIEFENGKIKAPLFGWINPLLVDGNSKLGKGVWTFSMLPGNFWYKVEIDGETMETCGTCNCNCPGCYAQTGFYNMPSVIRSNAIKTILARLYPDFVRRAITAQIWADNIKLCRIHASGDFFNAEYISAWREIVKACEACVFWTYTKNQEAENAFNDLANINIVKSIIPGYGFNFGHCDYILRVYKALKELGKTVYICRCGIDKNQHCTNCKGCSKNDFVLFIEHSTNYCAEKDALYGEVKTLIESQTA